MNLKTCIDCGVEKPLSDYYRASNNKTGYRNQCKACVQKRKRSTDINAKLRKAYKECQSKSTVTDEYLDSLDVNMDNFDVINYKGKHYLVENASVQDILRDKSRTRSMEDVIRYSGLEIGRAEALLEIETGSYADIRKKRTSRGSGGVN